MGAKVQEKLSENLQEKQSLVQQNKAKWGFLKNIVNIDRFFASGAGDASAATEKLAQVEDD
jgi:hypothetical protein